MVKAWWDDGGAFPPSFHHQDREMNTKKGQDSCAVKSPVPNMKEAKCASIIEIYIQFDRVSSLFFLFVNHLCINLCCANIGVPQHFADCIEVCSTAQLERGVCMAETVEGDVLGDTSSLYPSFNWF